MKKIKKILWEYNTIFKESDALYRRAAKVLGISECAFWILYTIRTEEKAVTQKDICGMLYHPKQTVNSALKKLESEGYIVLSERDSRRSKSLELTAAGEVLAEKTADRVIEAELEAFSGLTPEERDSFIKIFGKYTDLLKNKLPH